MFNPNDLRWSTPDLSTDDNECQRKINRLKKDLEDWEKNYERINELYGKEVKDSIAKAKKIRELEEDVEDLQEKLEKCQKRQKDLEEKLEKCQEKSNKADELEDQLKECQDKRKELEKQLKECQEEKKKLEDKIKELENQLKECQDQNNGNDDDLVITNDKEVAKFIMEVLDKAIPYSARIKNCRNGKHIINKDEEISDLKPSTLLLQRKEKDGLVLKIWQEILMTNFWNGDSSTYGLYSAWAMNTLDYSSKGNWGVNYRLFPKTHIKNHANDSIIWSGMLFHSKNQLYFDKIFEIIEQYLQKHGVNCTVEKTFNPSHGRIWGTKKVIVSHGSLPFPKAKINATSANDPYYYLQVSFDIKMKSSNKVYPIRGYTMLLTDALNLYKIGNTATDDKNDNSYDDIYDEFD